jgi:hypothetical protein
LGRGHIHRSECGRPVLAASMRRRPTPATLPRIPSNLVGVDPHQRVDPMPRVSDNPVDDELLPVPRPPGRGI